MFRFKQFNVDQTGCGMKINTDGVLLGALAQAEQPKTILDIGTGTGVIALMLAQGYVDAQIYAVEIDQAAAQTAEMNFKNSPFADRLHLYSMGFEQFFAQHPNEKYDLIVSNPPFFINSLKSPKANKDLAKHTDEVFFKTLVESIAKHLSAAGRCYLILPLDVAWLVKGIALNNHLFVASSINIHSYKHSEPHRQILILSSSNMKMDDAQFVIYEAEKQYSENYEQALKDFFTIF